MSENKKNNKKSTTQSSTPDYRRMVVSRADPSLRRVAIEKADKPSSGLRRTIELGEKPKKTEKRE